MPEERNTEGKGKGLLIKDEEGNIYFLRPEILTACKVSMEDLEARPQMKELAEVVRTLRAIGADVEQFESRLGDVDVLGAIEMEQPFNQELQDRVIGSTLMCPW